MMSQAEKFAEAARAGSAPSLTEPKPPRGWRHYARRIVIDVLIGYVLICIFFFFYQKKIVYQPGKAEALAPADSGFAAQQARAIQAQTSDGLTLNGWQIAGGQRRPPHQGPPPYDKVARASPSAEFDLSKAALVELFFYGNAGNRSDRSPTFRRQAGLGLDVVCFDYRGYGDNAGSPSEEGLAKDARAAWDWLLAKGVKPQSIVIHGESLGGGVAARLASEVCAEGAPPAGLILEATFTRLPDAGAAHFWFLPVSLILTQKFPSIERIPKVTCPILILHGTRDDVVPFKLGRRLFEAAPAQSSSGIAKQFAELACGHNDVGIVDSVTYRQHVQQFLGTLNPQFAVKESLTPPTPRQPHTPKPHPSKKPGN